MQCLASYRWTPALILAEPCPATPVTLLHLHYIPGSHQLEAIDTDSAEDKRKIHSAAPVLLGADLVPQQETHLGC